MVDNGDFILQERRQQVVRSRVRFESKARNDYGIVAMTETRP